MSAAGPNLGRVDTWAAKGVAEESPTAGTGDESPTTGTGDKSPIVLRAARPTLNEGVVYSRYLHELAPGFRISLGRRSQEFVAAAYVRPGHNLSYEHVTFAERGGAIVGLMSGYTAEQHRNSSAEALKQAIGSRLLQRMGAALLVAFLRRFGPGRDDFYVWALAVEEELRGRGVGSVLMDFAEEQARARGLARLSLDVEAKNDGARRFYERRGMVVEYGWPGLPFIPAVTFRMAKRL